MGKDMNKKLKLALLRKERGYLIPSSENLDVDPNSLLDLYVKYYDEYINNKSSYCKLYFPKEDKYRKH